MLRAVTLALLFLTLLIAPAAAGFGVLVYYDDSTPTPTPTVTGGGYTMEEWDAMIDKFRAGDPEADAARAAAATTSPAPIIAVIGCAVAAAFIIPRH